MQQDLSLNLLETFVFLSEEDAASQLVKGTDSYYYFRLLKLLQNEKKYTDQIHELMEAYQKLGTPLFDQIELRALLLQYDNLDDQDDKKHSTLLKICKYLSLTPRYPFINETNSSNSQFENFQQDDQQAHVGGPRKGRSNSASSSENESDFYAETQDLGCSQSVDLQSQIRRAYTLNGLQRIKPCLYHLLNMEQLSRAEQEVKVHFLQSGVSYLAFVENIETLVSSLDYETNGHLSLSFCEYLTVSQLQKIKELSPIILTSTNFVEIYYQKLYGDFDRESASYDEIVRQYQIIYDWAKLLPPKFSEVSCLQLEQILHEQLRNNKIESKYFFEYLEHPIIQYYQINQTYLNRKIQDDLWKYSDESLKSRFWKNYDIKQSGGRFFENSNRVEKYITLFLENKGSVDDLKQYFEENYIERLHAQVKLFAGEHIELINQIFTQSEIEQIKDSRSITLCEYNKSKFARNETIRLDIEIKNIPKLTIKIYQADLQNYYLQNNQEFDFNINLDGVMPTYEISFDYNYPPIIKHKKQFEFEKLKAIGLYIIEFLGNGLLTRAVVQIGSLTLRRKLTVAGYAFQVFDENFELCSGPNTGVWISNIFYPIDNTQKEIIVPFPQALIQINVVAVHHGLAIQKIMELQKEVYELTFLVFHTQEQFVLHTNSNVLIYPRLRLQDQIDVPLSLLKNIEIRVTTASTTEEDFTQVLQQVVIHNDRQIPLTLQSVQNQSHTAITMRANLQLSNKVQTVLVCQRGISYSNAPFKDQFLRKSEQGYELYLYGKNGEPLIDEEVKIKVWFRGIAKEFKTKKKSDEKGRVILGRLILADRLGSYPTQGITQKEWDLNSEKNISRKSYSVLVNEQLQLPLKKQKFRIVKGQDSDYTKAFDYFDHELVFSQDHAELKFQKPGSYTIFLAEQLELIKINVLAGVRFHATDFIRSNNNLRTNKHQDDLFQVKDVDAKLMDQKYIISGSLKSTKTDRLNAFYVATNFLEPNQIEAQLAKLIKLLDEETITIKERTNHYFSNRRIGDEEQYVHNRKNQNRYIGNTLEKPQLLLFRQYIRDTDEQLSELLDNDYDSESQEEELEINEESENSCQNLKKLKKHKKKKVRGMYPTSGSRGACKGIKKDFKDQEESEQYWQAYHCANQFREFLRFPAIINSVQIQKDGTFHFEIPSEYRNLTVFFFNQTHYEKSVLTLFESDLKFIDTRQKLSLNQDKYYMTMRSAQIQETSVELSEEIDSANIRVIQTSDEFFEKVHSIYSKYRESSRYTEKIQVYKIWMGLELNQKLKLYDQNQCNEFNLFLYFQDFPFFELIVKDYIKNKIEKSVVDYFLLGNCDQFVNLEFLKLNNLEKVLCIIYQAEVKKNHSLAAQMISHLEEILAADLENLEERGQNYFDLLFGKKIMNLEDDNYMGEGGGGGGGEQQQYNQTEKPFEMQRIQAIIDSSRNAERLCDTIVDSNRNAEIMQNYGDEDRYFQIRNEQIQATYQNIERTKEYCELHYLDQVYYHVEERCNKYRITPFYIDVAKHSLEKGLHNVPFLSTNFTYSCTKFSEVSLVFTFMNFTSDTNTNKTQRLVFQKEDKEVEPKIKEDVLIIKRLENDLTQAECRPKNDVYTIQKGLPYKLEIIVSNCSPNSYKLELQFQIPEGSITVDNHLYRQSETFQLYRYQTQNYSSCIYFPEEGEFTIQPAIIIHENAVISVGKKLKFQVLKKITEVNEESWLEIVSFGSMEQILNFLSKKNLLGLEVGVELQPRLLNDKEFFLKVVEILRRRFYYSAPVWIVGIRHKDQQSIKEFFSQSWDLHFEKERFAYLSSSLFRFENIKYLEYYPLLQSRVHQQQKESNQILNVQFKQQYQSFLNYLLEKGVQDNKDKLVLIYYLILQEQIQQAIKIFLTVDQTLEDCQLQFDYLKAYLDFYIDYPNFRAARQICEKYMNYGVIYWRNLFYEIANQLAEYDGDVDQQAEDETLSKLNQNKILAEQEELFDAELDKSAIVIQCANLEKQNIKEIQIAFYFMDLELVFSKNPFLSQNLDQFIGVKENHRKTLKLEVQEGASLKQTLRVEIPEEIRQNNMIILLKAGSKRINLKYFSTSLEVQVQENSGQLKVSDSTGQYQQKVYVKVFIENDQSEVSFYKDGYTDLRGRFNYATLSVGSLEKIKRFSILISSDDKGSVVKEVKPPDRVGSFQSEVKLVSKNWSKKAQKCVKESEEVYHQYNQQRGHLEYKRY